jgi:dihydropteroate synthase
MSQKPKQLVCGKHELSLQKPLLMGILNLTPDSFSDGGNFTNYDMALSRAVQLVADGADILDIGGESTRPGAQAVSEDEELNRVVPVIEQLSGEIDIPISIDTSKATVMYEAVQAGASMINDVRALQESNTLETVAKLDVPVCLMHMQGEPRTMQKNIHYDNVVQDVLHFLMARAEVCTNSGITGSRIIIDPGFGFGKTLAHNLSLLKALPEFVKTGYPVLAGLSRKSMIGELTGKPVEERLAGSLALAAIAINSGAQIIRVHDVAETKDILSIYAAVNSE